MTDQSDLEIELINQHGPVMGGKKLMQAMGYKSMPGFRKAIRENRLGIKIFEMPGHRGKYALTTDVANFILNCAKE